MFDVLPATRSDGDTGVATALLAAIGAHGVLFLALAVLGVALLDTVEAPPIQVRFFAAPSAAPLAPAAEAPPARPQEPIRFYVGGPTDGRGVRMPSALQPTEVADTAACASGATTGTLTGTAGATATTATTTAKREPRGRRERDAGTLVGVDGGAGRALEDLPLEVGGDVRAPDILEQVKPEYPQSALLAGTQGTVIVSAVIGADGGVEDVRGVTGDRLLTQSALAAVRLWRFRPGMLNGKAVRVSFTLTVRFVIVQPGEDAASAPASSPADATAAPPRRM